MQIRDELALMRWRSNNAFASPVVVRVTYGGYLKGGADLPLADRRLALHRHARASAWSARARRSTPTGCSAPRSAATTRCIFLEHKHLYRQTYNKAPNPGPNFMIPFGKAKVVARRAPT